MKKEDIKKANELVDEIKKMERYIHGLERVKLGRKFEKYSGIKMISGFGDDKIDYTNDDIQYLDIESDITEFIDKMLDKYNKQLNILNAELNKI